MVFHSFMYFIPAFHSAGSGTAARGRLETHYGFQQSLIVLLAPHQDGTKQGWRCIYTTSVSWSTCRPLSVGTCLDNLFRGNMVTRSTHRCWDLPIRRRRDSTFRDVRNFTVAHFLTTCHTCGLRRNLISAARTWDIILSIITQDSLPAEDRSKDRFKNWQLFGVWKILFCDHGTKAHAELRLLDQSLY